MGKASQDRSLSAWETNQVLYVVGEDGKSQRSHPGWIRIAGSRGGPETDKTGRRMQARRDGKRVALLPRNLSVSPFLERRLTNEAPIHPMEQKK